MALSTEALLVVAVALLVIYASWALFKQQKLNLPPGPTPLPIIGSLHLLGTLPQKSLAELAKKYGPVMSVWLGQRLFIVATSPEAAKEFLKVQDANFCFRPPFRAAKVLVPKDIVLHDITPVNRHLRKIFVSELTSARRLEASKNIRAEELAYMLRTVSKEKGPFRVNTHFHIITTNIVSRMVLSKRFLGEGDQTGEAMSAVTNSTAFEFISITEDMARLMGAIHPQDYFNFLPEWFDPQRLEPQFRKQATRMKLFYTKLVNEHKEERRKNPVSEDKKTMLDVLLEQLENPEFDVTEEHVSCTIWDALMAGTDTTMVTSEWAMTEILRNPAILKEVRAELDRVVGSDRTVQESDVPKLKYMQAVVKETLRLHPPVAMLIPHLNMNPTKAFGYDIPSKTRVFVNSWGIGRDPKVWDEPLEFQPKRFLEGGLHAGMDLQGQQQFDMLPFGSGRRLCPGVAFAVTSVNLQVASMFHAFDWSCPPGVEPEKLDMSETATFVLQKRDPLLVVAKPRLSLHLY
ncbi:hypothetical protein KC19_5G072200 [Ceratodon purpureus]|uniref:Cytochrome P450 n=2 Tax=Ceratodon purpureus TaxID=3225 RepID=A0A8T0I125_CERPU|nr:hypothetical protein KC19_5G072200 [Ceratodon purpureus]